MSGATSGPEPAALGPIAFFRRYTKTWIHTVSTAGLTAFGTLTFVNRWFAVLAIGSYVVPPLVLYARQRRTGDGLPGVESSGDESEREPADASSDREPASADVSHGRSDDASVGRDRASTPEPAADRSGGVERDEVGRDARPDEEESDARPDEEESDVRSEEEEESDGQPDEEVPDETADDRFADWQSVDVPTAESLSGVVVTASSVAYAAGSNGIVLESDAPGEWSVVLEDGPAASGNDLRGVDATDDGGSVWIAGDGGSLARIDAETGRHTDYTAPSGITDNWTDVAVAGPDDDATILLTEGSGGVLRGRYRDGDLEWDERTTLGSGSSLAGIDLADAGVGYCCSTNDAVFETTDGGEAFDRVGLEGADGTLEGVAAGGTGDCLVCADDGVVHRYDGSAWTPERVCEAALTGIASREDRAVVAVEDGTVYERPGAAADWEPREGGGGGLLAVAVGPGRLVAVGDEGTVLERTVESAREP